MNVNYHVKVVSANSIFAPMDVSAALNSGMQVHVIIIAGYNLGFNSQLNFLSQQQLVNSSSLIETIRAISDFSGFLSIGYLYVSF